MNSDLAKMIAEAGTKLDSERSAQKAEVPQTQDTPTNGTTVMTATEIGQVIAQSLPGQKLELVFKPEYLVSGVCSLLVDVRHGLLSWATESQVHGNKLMHGLIHPQNAETTFIVETPTIWLDFRHIIVRHISKNLKSVRVLST